MFNTYKYIYLYMNNTYKYVFFIWRRIRVTRNCKILVCPGQQSWIGVTQGCSHRGPPGESGTPPKGASFLAGWFWFQTSLPHSLYAGFSFTNPSSAPLILWGTGQFQPHRSFSVSTNCQVYFCSSGPSIPTTWNVFALGFSHGWFLAIQPLA